MKSYSIGREETCNIRLYDTSNMVSRRHATLNVNGNKMTITDHSSNGTYINGIRITSGTPVPVTRKDVVSFAQTCELDWKLIPNPAKKIWISVVLALLVIGSGLAIASYYKNEHKQNEYRNIESIAAADSLLRVRINSLSAKIEKITVDFDSLTVDKSNVDIQVKNKPQGNKLNDVIKDLGKIESYMDEIDIPSLKDDFKTAKQSVEDRVDSKVSEKRVKETEEKAAEYASTIESAAKLMVSVKKNLKGISDKPAPKKENKPAVKKDTVKVERNDSIKDYIW